MTTSHFRKTVSYLKGSPNIGGVSLVGAAKHAGCSRWTLMNHLSMCGTSWMRLLNEERHARFRQAVIDCDEITMGAMADHLGVTPKVVGDLAMKWSGKHFRDYKNDILLESAGHQTKATR